MGDRRVRTERGWRLSSDLTFEGGPAEQVAFAHNSERQFARLLDFYGIEWEYEPRAFPISWDAEGAPTGYFAPDFYLPDEDVFIEITTMNQRLVTRKNRKVRRLRQLYPEVTCKIFYQRDYLQLLVKYGLEEPDQLDGTPTPTRIPGPPDVAIADDTSTG